ncbi:hypothetical protein HELRODRAFT_182211 [Helobdella robusta]|uniref:G-protein coupled receptors family 1 profile domain-containing protein n=1 Tax=Helobdella robusta TaxID=6412 RepID=T1FHX7_HELRO|nr:hypothetical protein HELRODRAFT_182211 [Helobdella robusta]ESN91136.1 hypothetical protein HELRODRAFT_182211 [Helobdella robusta]
MMEQYFYQQVNGIYNINNNNNNDDENDDIIDNNINNNNNNIDNNIFDNTINISNAISNFTVFLNSTTIYNDNIFYNNYTNINNKIYLKRNYIINSLIYRDGLSISLLAVFFLLMFLLGFLGNISVVAIVLRNKQMHNLTNYFIVNLAIADLLVTIFCIPITFAESFVYGWHYSALLCKLTPYLQGVSVIASVYTLTAISLDRYLAICQVFEFRMTKTIARRIIIIIWMLALVMVMPWLMVYQLKPSTSLLADNRTFYICLPSWRSDVLAMVHFMGVMFVCCYVLPLLMITCFYLLIARKVVKMIMVVVVLFAISWLPLYMAFIFIYFTKVNKKFITESAVFMKWLCQMNSCINPIIYCLFSKKFRSGMKRLVPGSLCCGNARRFFATNQFTTSGRRNRQSTLRSDEDDCNAGHNGVVDNGGGGGCKFRRQKYSGSTKLSYLYGKNASLCLKSGQDISNHSPGSCNNNNNDNKNNNNNNNKKLLINNSV